MAENNHFIERSLMAVLVLFKESIFSEDCASRKGFLQARDPRVKALMIFVLLLAALFSRSIPFIAGIYGFCLVLALVSSIDILFFWERTLFFIPFSLYLSLLRRYLIFLLPVSHWQVSTCSAWPSVSQNKARQAPAFSFCGF
jgi:energy-coupling factor transporter transmembrane protein EcfT